MSRTIVDAELRVYKPGASDPALNIPGGDIDTAELTERAGGRIDQGQFDIENTHGRYDDATITTGARLEFDTQLEGEASLTRRWTAVAKPPKYSLSGSRMRSISIPASDFATQVLEWRQAYRDFEQRQISGSLDAIVETLLEAEAPELDRSKIASVPQATDLFANGRTLRELIVEDLAPIADAIVAQDGTSLIFEPLADVDVKHALTPGDFRGEVSVDGRDDSLTTLVRVDGGTAHEIDDEQPTQSSTTRVTNTDRITAQVQTRKAEVDRVQIWTNPDSSTSDDLVVRLQADRGGSPVAVGNTQSDLARRRLSSGFLDDGGWTTFLLPDHNLNPGESPWLIVETTGSTGHDVGVDGSGNLAYKAEYPYPLLTRSLDGDAQSEYRRRDHRIRDDSLDTFAGVRDTARAHIRHNNRPTRRISGTAESVRAHNLSPGDAVGTTAADWQGAPVSGEYLVTERKTSYDGERNRITTTLTLQEAESL
jgi:hypothetical protein